MDSLPSTSNDPLIKLSVIVTLDSVSLIILVSHGEMLFSEDITGFSLIGS